MLGMQHRFICLRSAKSGELFVEILVTTIQQINFWIGKVWVGLFVLSPIGTSEITITATSKKLWLVDGFVWQVRKVLQVGSSNARKFAMKDEYVSLVGIL